MKIMKKIAGATVIILGVAYFFYWSIQKVERKEKVASLLGGREITDENVNAIVENNDGEELLQALKFGRYETPEQLGEIVKKISSTEEFSPNIGNVWESLDAITTTWYDSDRFGYARGVSDSLVHAFFIKNERDILKKNPQVIGRLITNYGKWRSVRIRKDIYEEVGSCMKIIQEEPFLVFANSKDYLNFFIDNEKSREEFGTFPKKDQLITEGIDHADTFGDYIAIIKAIKFFSGNIGKQELEVFANEALRYKKTSESSEDCEYLLQQIKSCGCNLQNLDLVGHYSTLLLVIFFGDSFGKEALQISNLDTLARMYSYLGRGFRKEILEKNQNIPLQMDTWEKIDRINQEFFRDLSATRTTDAEFQQYLKFRNKSW
jgi:hypothetical protein